jgi:hypothetical protein
MLKSRIPKQILKGLADIGGFGPYIQRNMVELD